MSCGTSFSAVIIKEEPHWQEHGAGSAGRAHELQIKPEPESCCSDDELKQEPADRHEARVKSEDPLSLYEGHDVKREMVIGPEVLQQSEVIGPKKDNTKAPEPTVHHCNHSCRLLSCDIRRKTDIITHMEVPYDSCDKKFNFTYGSSCHQQMQILRRHLLVHNTDKPFTCDICNKKFPNRSRLVWHLRVHSGEKPFHCDICNKKFTDSSNLRSHLRIHNGDKPFTCDICNKKFTQKCSLTRHLLVHSKAKPFACDVCDKKFSHKPSLKYHITNVCTGLPERCLES